MSRIGSIFTFLVLLFPVRAFSFGEVFKLETTGTEYCGHFDLTKFNAKNNTDLWVEVVSETELNVSTTADFQAGTSFSMLGVTYQTATLSGAFVAAREFANGGYVTIQGIAKVNARTGNIASLSGAFIQHNMFDDDCFSSGKFKTIQRIR
jgi:hypothetical protein